MEPLLAFLDFRSIYLLVVISIALFLLLRGLFFIRTTKRRLLKRTASMDFSEAVLSPENLGSADQSNINDQATALQSIETRFEFMKRFYIPLILIISLIFITLPFLPTIPATYLSLLTGLLAGIVGLAARPVIENAIAGMVLTFSQPIRINDTVIIDGHYGTVEKINLLHTVIKVWNWRRLVVPNHKLLEKEIENLTFGEEKEWAYISFFVEPNADIKLVNTLAKESMECAYLDKGEEPSFWVMDMKKDSILCWVAGWASDPARVWALKASARRNLIEKLKQNKISFQLTNTNINLAPKDLSEIDVDS